MIVSCFRMRILKFARMITDWNSWVSIKLMSGRRYKLGFVIHYDKSSSWGPLSEKILCHPFLLLPLLLMGIFADMKLEISYTN